MSARYTLRPDYGVMALCRDGKRIRQATEAEAELWDRLSAIEAAAREAERGGIVRWLLGLSRAAEWAKEHDRRFWYSDVATEIAAGKHAQVEAVGG